MTPTKKLRIFLCHALEDRPAVRALHKKLADESWIEPWLGEEILPGQDLRIETQKAIDNASVILICLSKISIAQEGYIQREIKYALEKANEKPEGSIFIVPLRLDECEPPIQFNRWQWVDYFDDFYFVKLTNALRLRAQQLGIIGPSPVIAHKNSLYSYVHIPNNITSSVSYPFYISKYPVTNSQFERFINSSIFYNIKYWSNFPNYGDTQKSTKHWGENGVNWLKQQFKGYESFPSEKLIERGNLKQKIWKYWDHPTLGQQRPDNPVVGINWYVANAYCKWLLDNWDTLQENSVNRNISPKTIRLPSESEWLLAAGGKKPYYRYPWDDPDDMPKQLTEKINENPIVLRLLSWVLKKQKEKLNNYQKKIIERANVFESLVQGTTPVDSYSNGASPYGVMDMAGNVWEFVADFIGGIVPLHGGSWKDGMIKARVGYSESYNFGWHRRWNNVGFRLVVSE